MLDRRPILMLIDGPSLVYRGYFALPPLTTSDGTLVNAAFGFLQIVLRGGLDDGRLAHHLGVRLRQPSQVVGGGALRGDPGKVHLEERAHLVHLLEVDVAAAEKKGHRLAYRLGVDRRDTEPAPRAHLDHALGDECAHRFADDGARDAELLSELPLRREAVTHVEPIREDRLQHPLRNLVREARLSCDEREQGRVTGRRSRTAHRPIIRHTACRSTLDDWYAVV